MWVMENEWAPVLDPAWARAYASFERNLDELIELEHGPCECPICFQLGAEREWAVATSWVLLGADEQAQWMDARGMTEHGAALRDALACVDQERLDGLIVWVETMARQRAEQEERRR